MFRVSSLIVLRVLVAVCLLFALRSTPAWAVCIHPDVDADGYYPPGPGCPMPSDCNNLSAAVAPNQFEDLDTSADDNCNGRTALFPMWAEQQFAAAGPGAWSEVGAVVHEPATGEVQIGSVTDSAPASITRSGLSVGLNFSVAATMWSELGVPDDSSTCGEGSYLVVGTRGQGTWRGEFTW